MHLKIAAKINFMFCIFYHDFLKFCKIKGGERTSGNRKCYLRAWQRGNILVVRKAHLGETLIAQVSSAQPGKVQGRGGSPGGGSSSAEAPGWKLKPCNSSLEEAGLRRCQEAR